MTKILVIGQAPPAVKQRVPYDTTMFYDWLSAIGISQDEAQNLFEFEAVYNKFPGYDSKGGHNPPTPAQMDEHWKNTLEAKVQAAEKVWLLGKVAANYFNSRPKTWSCNLEVLETMHPSLRNKSWFEANKWQTLMLIEGFVKGLV